MSGWDGGYRLGRPPFVMAAAVPQPLSAVFLFLGKTLQRAMSLESAAQNQELDLKE